MAIKQYSLAKDGAKQLSPAFKVREFRCRDGSDAIMIDQTLVVLLHIRILQTNIFDYA